MAAIQIPYGGTSITIDVPDFALETTQQDIARESSESNSILSQIASHMGVEVKLSQQQSKAADQLITKIDQQTKETKSLGRQIKDNTRGILSRGLQGAQNMASGISGKESVADLMGKDGVLGQIPGLAVAGASIGSLFGILEEFSNTMGALRRVGAGVGIDLQSLRAEAASVGIGLETLSKIVTDNGVAIRSLGKNTVEGTRNFVELNRMLQEETKSLGYFGMAADELAAILTDEIEIRRRSGAMNANENMDRVALSKSIKENLRLQEAMAVATGTDLADRIKAQNNARRDAQVAMAQRNMSAEQSKALQQAFGNATMFGDEGSAGFGLITDLIKAQLLNVPVGTVEGAAGTGGIARSADVQLLETMRQVNEAIQAGDSNLVTELLGGLSNTLRDTNVQDINQLSRFNNDALRLIQMIGDATGYNAAEYRNQIDNPRTESEQRDIDLTATRLTMNEAAEEFRVLLMESILNAFKVPSVTDSNFSQFVDSLSEFPDSSKLKSFMNMVTQTTAMTSGAAGVLFNMTDIGDPTSEQYAVATALSVNAVLEGLGFDTGAAGKGVKLAALVQAGVDSNAHQELLLPVFETLSQNMNGVAEAMNDSRFMQFMQELIRNSSNN
jgi:hypothetical protein